MPEVDEAERIRQRLSAIEPRASQALLLRLVDGKSRADCARFYGVRDEAFDVKLFRAAQEYLGDRTVLPDEAEWAAAYALGQAIDASRRPSDPRVASLFDALAPIQTNAAAVRERLIAAERAAESSPERRREDLIRRLVMIAIIAVTAFLYFRSH